MFQEESNAASDGLPVPGTARDSSPASNEEQPVQQARRQGRGSAHGRVRGQAHGQGQGRGTARGNAQPPEFNWTYVDFYDDFDVDWVGTPCRNGVLIDTTDFQPVDYFKYCFPDDVFDITVTHTNLFATQFLQNRTLGSHSRYHKWTDTSVKEMQAYVALQIAMGKQ